VRNLKAWKCTSACIFVSLSLPFIPFSSRVLELEQDNARLLALTQNANRPSDELLSEIEQLRAKLAASEQRERDLISQLQHKSTSDDEPIKTEAVEAALPSPSSSRPPPAILPHKSGSSFGLMVGCRPYLLLNV
jgi:hypothetical protein